MILFEITEKFNSINNLRRHYIKHVKNAKNRREIPFGNISMKEYENIADELQNKEVDNINIFGYEVEKEGRKAYNKYDKNSQVFVAYYYEGNTPLTINCYKMNFDKFQRREKQNKIGDIPKGR